MSKGGTLGSSWRSQGGRGADARHTTVVSGGRQWFTQQQVVYVRGTQRPTKATEQAEGEATEKGEEEPVEQGEEEAVEVRRRQPGDLFLWQKVKVHGPHVDIV